MFIKIGKTMVMALLLLRIGQEMKYFALRYELKGYAEETVLKEGQILLWVSTRYQEIILGSVEEIEDHTETRRV